MYAVTTVPAANTVTKKERPAKLSYFLPRYPNAEYPVLAFLYAICAGGEHQIYCDFTEEYGPMYLIGRFQDPDFAESREMLIGVLSALDDRRNQEGHSTPTAAEWQIIGAVITAELKRGHLPVNVW